VSVGNTTVSAPLSRISPFLDPVSHSTDAEIDMSTPDGTLRPGMFVTVDVFYGESEDATLVPLAALYEDPATGRMGIYMTSEPLEQPPAKEAGSQQAPPLVGPVTFNFVPVEVLAEGRMEAAIRGAKEGDWVVTLGQNLMGAATADARVRPVDWARVERFQRLQREDLMNDLIEQRQTTQ
jgi:multidrug efflux pump subunit AcrA (membrane-fusion protein)